MNSEHPLNLSRDSGTGVEKFRVTFEFEAVRARFGEKMRPDLRVWDEIGLRFTLITSVNGSSTDLNRPGEKFVSVKVFQPTRVSVKGVENFQVTFDFDAVRARFDKKMVLSLRVWDEIRHGLINITDDGPGCPSDLNRPGEKLVSTKVELRRE